MNIESLEINLLKVSEIKDGDIVIVKIDKESQSKLNKDFIQSLYKEITKILNKEIPIYFFPSDISIEILKQTINTQNEIFKKI